MFCLNVCQCEPPAICVDKDFIALRIFWKLVDCPVSSAQMINTWFFASAEAQLEYGPRPWTEMEIW